MSKQADEGLELIIAEMIPDYETEVRVSLPDGSSHLTTNVKLASAEIAEYIQANYTPNQIVEQRCLEARLDEHDKVLEAFAEMIEKRVIKEDEPYNTSPKSMKSPLIRTRYRNDLRKQQRQALKNVISQLNNSNKENK